MGLQTACDFCGASDKASHRLFLYDINHPEPKSNYCVCDECLQKHILSNVPYHDEDKDVIPETMSAPSNQTFKGMTLREFLRTDYYLDDIDTIYVFQTAIGDTIVDLHTWMGTPILKVSRKNKDSKIFVTLDSSSENQN